MTEKVEIIGFIKDKNNIKGALSSNLNYNNLKITSAYYLFRSNARNDSMNDIIACFKDITNCNSAFEYNDVVDAPLFDTSSCTTFNSMFNGASHLKSLPEYDMSNAKDASNFCNACYQLESVPAYNWGSITGMNWYNSFTGCSALSDESLNNIMKSFSTMSNIASSQKRLMYAGLSEAQANRCTELPNWSILESDGWRTGY